MDVKFGHEIILLLLGLCLLLSMRCARTIVRLHQDFEIPI